MNSQVTANFNLRSRLTSSGDLSEVGEERDEFSPRVQINLPKEARHT